MKNYSASTSIFSSFVFYFLFCILTFPAFSSEKTAPSLETSPTTTVKGHASIVLRTNQKQNLKGMGLLLCPPDTAQKIKTVRNKRWIERSSPRNFNDGFRLLDLNAIGYTAVQNASYRTKSDKKGNFSFTHVKPGDYLLYGQYKGRYAVAYWLIPVTVKADQKEVSVMINNDNIKEVYNLYQ